MADFKWELGFDVDKTSLQNIKATVDRLRKEAENDKIKMKIDDSDFNHIKGKIDVFEKALLNAFNPNLGKINLKKFMTELKDSGNSLQSMRRIFAQIGVDGSKSFAQMENSMRYTGMVIKENNKLLDEMALTFKNTLKWNIASGAIHQVQGAIQRSIGFTEDLDDSLNNIRIVTSASAEDMEVFARQANEASKALGKTTVEYSDASLLFFQQGKGKREVEELTRATLIGSNITGQEVSETAELLTAALNGFNKQGDYAMKIMDKFAAVGATTGSDFEELATGFSKVASMASSAGVEIDQLNGMLATISTVTRESPESIGTSLKTIFGRMSEVKAGKEDEDGWTLGRVEEALNKVSLSVVDANGRMKDMGALMEEVGDKWANFNKETKMGLSTALAGNRQQNRLISLFNNWEMYRDALKESAEAEGEAERQNLIRMDSVAYKSKQLKAELEELWSKVIDSKMIKSIIDGLTDMVSGVNDFVDALGGIEPLLWKIGILAGGIFSKQIAGGLERFGHNVKALWGSMTNYASEMKGKSPEDIQIKKNELLINRALGEEQQKEYLALVNTVDELKRKIEYEELSIKNKKEMHEITLQQLADQTAEANDAKAKYQQAQAKVAELQQYSNGASVGTIENIFKNSLGMDDKLTKSITEGLSGNVEYNQILERLNANIVKADGKLASYEKRADSVKKGMDRLTNSTSEYARKINGLNDKIDKSKDRMNEMVTTAQKAQRMTTIVQGAFAAAGVINAVTDATRALGDEMLSTGQKVQSVGNSIGMSLMMIPHPAAMVTGAIVTLGSVLAQFYFDNTGVNKAIKDNKKIAEQTAKAITEAKDKMKELKALTEDYNKLRSFMKDGAVNRSDLSAKELITYNELAAKIAELAPELVSYYDDQGNAIIDLTKNLEELNKAQKEQVRINNEIKAANAKSFATEYGNTIEKAQKKIDSNESALSGPTAPKNAAKLKAEIEEQQAKLKEANAGIKSNIIEPLYAGSAAYQNLTEKQREMARELFSVEDATRLIYDPERLGVYTDELSKVLGALQNNETLSKSLDGLERNRRQNMIENLSLLNLEGDAYSKALGKMTEYYNSTNTLQQGPMTTGQLENITGAKKTASEATYETAAQGSMESIERNANKVDEIGQKITALRELIHNTESDMNLPLSARMALMEDYKKDMDELLEQEKAYKDAQWESNKTATEFNLSRIEEIKLNDELEEKYWDQIETLAETTEGYNQLAEAYNNNVDILADMNAAIGETGDAETFSQKEMDGMAQSLEAYRDKIPGLSEALDQYYNSGRNSIDGLRDYMGEASAAMAEQNGRMYAIMHKDDQAYFQEFLSLNRTATDQLFVEYGVRAQNYNTLADYEKAVAQAKEKGKLDLETQSLNQQILNEANATNQKAGFAQTDVNNTGAASSKKVSIWQQMTKAGLTLGEKMSLGWYYVWDSITKGCAGMANAVIDILNGIIAKVESMVNSIGGGINDLISKLPEPLQEKLGGVSVGSVSFGRLNHVSGTSLAANYSASLAEKYADSDVDFNYGSSDPTKKVSAKPLTSTNPISSSTGAGLGETGPGITDGGGKDSGKTQEDMEWEKDALHDTNVLLQQQDNLLEQLKNDEEELYGKAKMDNLTQQNALLEQKRNTLQQQLDIIKQHGAELKNQLASQGVTFNEDGTVSNYNQLLEAKVNAANAIADPDAKKAAQDAVKDLIDDLKDYEDFILKTKFDKEQAIQEVEKLQREIQLEQFEYVIKVQLELSEDQQDILKFTKDMRKEFEGISETYGATVGQLNSKVAEMAAIQAHINEIQNNTALTEKERIELLEEYDEKLKDATEEAADLREELIKINENALKNGIELLDQHISKFENINSELSHLSNMLKLIGEGDNYEQLDRLFEVQEASMRGQLDALLASRSSLQAYVDKLEVGSEEWEYANEQLAKMDEQLQKTTEETLKLFQEELKSSVEGILDSLDKALNNGVDTDEVTRQLRKMKEEQEKYLSIQEKIVWAGQMQNKIQKQIDASTNPATKAKLQEFLDTELETLKQKDKLTQYDVDRAEKLYEITQKQIALDEARNNRTIMRLVRDSAGNWAYQYVEDVQKVADAQADLSDSLADLMESDQDQLLRNQEEMIAAREEFRKRMQEILENALNGEYATQEEYNAAVQQAQDEFNATMELLQMESSEVRENIAESTLAAVLNTYATNSSQLGILTAEQEELMRQLGEHVGTNWTEISALIDTLNSDNADSFRTKFKDVIEGDASLLFQGLKTTYGNISAEWDNSVYNLSNGNANWRDDVANAVNSINDKWLEYQTKVGEITNITNTNIDGIISRTEALASATNTTASATDAITDRIYEEWSAVGDLIAAYQDLDAYYDDLIGDAEAYVLALDEQIKKMKEAATAVQTPTNPEPTPTPTPTPEPTPTPPPAPAPEPAPAPKTPSTGGRARVNVANAPAYLDSAGTRVRPWADQARAAGIAYDASLYVVNAKNGKIALGKTSDVSSAIAWVNLSDAIGLRSGGYTGEWGNDGRIAMLHEKELVLNKEDTSNILDAVKIVRDYASMLRQAFGGSLSSVMGWNKDRDIQQSVVINADFSGVKSSSEIEVAFENLVNRASQYALGNKK